MKTKKSIIKTLVLFALFLIAKQSSSQALLGYTPEEVRNNFKNVKWSYGKDNDFTTMSFNDDNKVVVSYYFDKNDTCVFTLIVPIDGEYSEKIVQDIIQAYNKKYVATDDKNWEYVLNEKMMRCRLKEIKNGDKTRSYFEWYW